MLHHRGEVLDALTILPDAEDADAVENPTDDEEDEHGEHHEQGDTLYPRLGSDRIGDDMCE